MKITLGEPRTGALAVAPGFGPPLPEEEATWLRSTAQEHGRQIADIEGVLAIGGMSLGRLLASRHYLIPQDAVVWSARVDCSGELATLAISSPATVTWVGLVVPAEDPPGIPVHWLNELGDVQGRLLLAGDTRVTLGDPFDGRVLLFMTRSRVLHEPFAPSELLDRIRKAAKRIACVSVPSTW